MIAIAQQDISGDRALEAASAEDRFSEFVVRQSRFVFRVAYSVTRNVADAEDVTQETFLRLYRKGGWDRIEEERAFLARVAWRIALDRMPKRKGEAGVTEVVATGSNPEQSAIACDWEEVVQRLIDALPEDLRAAVVFTATDELSAQEIAKVLNIPEGTVRNRLFRARQILKQKLSALMERSIGK